MAWKRQNVITWVSHKVGRTWHFHGNSTRSCTGVLDGPKASCLTYISNQGYSPPCVLATFQSGLRKSAKSFSILFYSLSLLPHSSCGFNDLALADLRISVVDAAARWQGMCPRPPNDSRNRRAMEEACGFATCKLFARLKNLGHGVLSSHIAPSLSHSPSATANPSTGEK